ncbi:MAG: hypothetical protein ACKOUR_03475 [Planctomycetota bacterium]
MSKYFSHNDFDVRWPCYSDPAVMTWYRAKNNSGSSNSNDLGYGGIGDDYLNGQHGNDVLYGEDGDDVVFGGEGIEVVSGGRGRNVVVAATNSEPRDARLALLQDLVFTAVTNSHSLPIPVSQPNQPPQVMRTITDRVVPEGGAFEFAIDSATFQDPDAGDLLTYSAYLADGSNLPTQGECFEVTGRHRYTTNGWPCVQAKLEIKKRFPTNFLSDVKPAQTRTAESASVTRHPTSALGWRGL